MPDRLDRMQGVIARRPPGAHQAVMFFRIGTIEGARQFLRRCLPMVPSAREVAGREPPFLFVSLAWNAISRLVQGVPGLMAEEGRAQLEPFFCEPLPLNPARLGFDGASAPEKWWSRAWGSADIDLVVHGVFADLAQASRESGRLLADARACGLELLAVPDFPDGVLSGYLPPGGVLHFGFRDGLSEPDVDWSELGQGSVDLREFLLGYPTVDYPTAPNADGPWRDFVRDSTIACVAWIEQHVSDFARFLDEASVTLAGFAPVGQEREWLAARLLGRWPDGSPTVTWPHHKPPNPDTANAFDYAADPDGTKCPLTSHIRIVNLRNDKMSYANRLRFPKGPPRFIRRGFSYGPPFTGTDDGTGRGIVGTFLCARLNEQFHTVLRWMNATDFTDRFDRAPYATDMQDAMFGTRDAAGRNAIAVLENEGGRQQAIELRRFITYRGVAHAMMLSLPSLHRLAVPTGSAVVG